MKKNKKLNGTDIGIIFSVIGMIASIVVIIMNFIDGESKSVGIALLCSCAAVLSTNVRNKRSEQ